MELISHLGRAGRYPWIKEKTILLNVLWVGSAPSSGSVLKSKELQPTRNFCKSTSNVVRTDRPNNVAEVGVRYESMIPEIWNQTGRNPNAFTYATARTLHLRVAKFSKGKSGIWSVLRLYQRSGRDRKLLLPVQSSKVISHFPTLSLVQA